MSDKLIKLVIKAGSAKPAPPVGPALGQHGLNIMGFCKEFNARTADLKPDVPVPVEIKAKKDKSFSFVTKTPPVTYFVKKAAGLTKGSTSPGHSTAGFLTLKHVYEIAKIKKQDPSNVLIDLPSICRNIMGTCRAMGIKVLTKEEMEAKMAEAETQA